MTITPSCTAVIDLDIFSFFFFLKTSLILAPVDESKTNGGENRRAKQKTHRHEAFLHEGCEHVRPDGDHDVPEVQG